MNYRKLSLSVALFSTLYPAFAQITPAASHLVLSEIGAAAPGSAEFTEIYNPTGTAVNLSNYYISDHNLYFDLPSVVSGQISNTLNNGSDHLVRLPNITIPSGGVVVVCHQASTFLNVYFNGDLSKFTSLPGSPQLVEVNETRGDVINVAANYNRTSPDYPLSDPGTPAASGNNLNHTDTDESTVLFYWDGTSSLVKDLDMMHWRAKDNPWGSSSNQLANKSGISGMGPGGVLETYAFDLGNTDNLTAHFLQPLPLEVGSGNFIRHSLLEPGETLTGGNGLNGHDESLEQIDLTWKIVYGSGSNGSPGLVDFGLSSQNQAPVVGFAQRNIQYPAPGATIHVTCPVYDDGSMTVRLMVAKGTGAYVATTMTHEGNNIYGADISTAGLAEGTPIKYYVEATDSGNLVSRETDLTFRHMPWSGVHNVLVKTGAIDPNSIIVSEVMYNPQGGNNYRHAQYIELYNPATTGLDVSGYVIKTNFTDTDGVAAPDGPNPLRPVHITMPEGTVIPAKGYIVVAGQKEVLWRRYPGMDLSKIVNVDIEPARSWMAHAGSTFYFFGPNEFDFNDTPVDNSAAFKTFAYQNNANGWPQGATGITPPNMSAGDTGYSIELKSLVPGSEGTGSNWAVGKFFQGSPLANNSVDTTLRPGDVTVTQPTRSVLNPTPSDSIEIATTVASSTPIASVALWYSVNNGVYTQVAMTNTSGDNYSGTLSGLPDNSLIKYYVEATDTSSNKGTYPAIAPVGIVPFRVESVLATSNILLNEVMFNPQGTDNKTYPEYFELYNAGSTPIDMSYYQWSGNTSVNLGDNAVRLIPEGIILPPGERLVLTARKSHFAKNYLSPFKSVPRHLYGEIDESLVIGAGWNWGNSIIVNTTSGNVNVIHPNSVDYSGTVAGVPFINFTYLSSTTNGWPGAGANASIELKVAGTDPTLGPNWAFSLPWNGTPQAHNSTSPPPSSVSDWALF